MTKIAIYKRNDGYSLVIWKTPKEKLVGEVYKDIYRRNKWNMRSTFEGKDATEYRVKEFFGFNTSNSIAYWKRWA